MNDLKGFYDNYNGETKAWPTDVDFLLSEVSEILKLKYDGLDIITQVGLFLDKEEEQIKNYIQNLAVHYTYKRIFNKSNKYFQNNKQLFFDNDIEFKKNFQDYIKTTFDLQNYENCKKFSNSLLNSILSNEKHLNKDCVNGRPLDAENKAMRKFAVDKNRSHCYLCGIQTKNKTEKGNINLYHWHKENKTELSVEIFEKFKEMLHLHNEKIEKEILSKIENEKTLKSDILYHLNKKFPKIYNLFTSKKQKTSKKINLYKITNKTIDNLFENISLNKFHKEFKFAYAKHNNDLMKIEHCIAVDWGGGKSEDNLLISCHKCNQKKSNTVFFTEYSINKFFINEFEPEQARKAFAGTLGEEALISLKIRQNFKCSNCTNNLSDFGTFYLRRINEEDGYHYLNTLITCKHCLSKLNKLNSNTFFDEYIKIKE